MSVSPTLSDLQYSKAMDIIQREGILAFPPAVEPPATPSPSKSPYPSSPYPIVPILPFDPLPTNLRMRVNEIGSIEDQPTRIERLNKLYTQYNGTPQQLCNIYSELEEKEVFRWTNNNFIQLEKTRKLFERKILKENPNFFIDDIETRSDSTTETAYRYFRLLRYYLEQDKITKAQKAYLEGFYKKQLLWANAETNKPVMQMRSLAKELFQKKKISIEYFVLEHIKNKTIPYPDGKTYILGAYFSAFKELCLLNIDSLALPLIREMEENKLFLTTEENDSLADNDPLKNSKECIYALAHKTVRRRSLKQPSHR